MGLFVSKPVTLNLHKRHSRVTQFGHTLLAMKNLTPNNALAKRLSFVFVFGAFVCFSQMAQACDTACQYTSSDQAANDSYCACPAGQHNVGNLTCSGGMTAGGCAFEDSCTTTASCSGCNCQAGPFTPSSTTCSPNVAGCGGTTVTFNVTNGIAPTIQWTYNDSMHLSTSGACTNAQDGTAASVAVQVDGGACLVCITDNSTGQMYPSGANCNGGTAGWLSYTANSTASDNTAPQINFNAPAAIGGFYGPSNGTSFNATVTDPGSSPSGVAANSLLYTWDDGNSADSLSNEPYTSGSPLSPIPNHTGNYTLTLNAADNNNNSTVLVKGPYTFDADKPAICMKVFSRVDQSLLATKCLGDANYSQPYPATVPVDVWIGGDDGAGSGLTVGPGGTMPEPSVTSAQIPSLPATGYPTASVGTLQIYEYQNLNFSAAPTVNYVWTGASAADRVGNTTGGYTFQVTMQVPSVAPNNLRTTPFGVTDPRNTTQLVYTWDTTGTPAGGYKLTFKNMTTNQTTSQTGISGNTFTYTTTPNSDIQATVEGCYDTGCTILEDGSNFTHEDWTAPADPINVSVSLVTATPKLVALSWNTNSNPTTPVTTYRYNFWDYTASAWLYNGTTRIAPSILPPAPQNTQADLTPNSKYYAWMTAQGAGPTQTFSPGATNFSSSSPSASPAFWTLPAAPNTPSLGSNTATSVTFNVDTADQNPALTQRTVRVSLASVNDFSNPANYIEQPVANGVATFPIGAGGLLAGQSYVAKTIADSLDPADDHSIDPTDTHSHDMPSATAFSFTTVYPKPSQVSIDNSVAPSATQFTIDVVAPSLIANGCVIVNYGAGQTAQLPFSNNALFTFQVPVQPTGANPSNTAYTNISALFTTFSCSAGSNLASPVTAISQAPFIAFTAAAKPAAPTVQAQTQTSLTITCGNNAANAVSTAYYIESSLDNGATWTYPGTICTGGAATINSGLQAGQQVLLKTLAYGAGRSSSSDKRYDAVSDVSDSAFTTFPSPRVSWNKAALSSNSFNVLIDTKTGVVPSNAVVKYTDASGTHTVPVSNNTGVAPFNANIVPTAPSANRKFTLVNAQVGPTGTPDASWSAFSTNDATVYTLPIAADPLNVTSNNGTVTLSFQVPNSDASGTNSNPDGTVYQATVCNINDVAQGQCTAPIPGDVHTQAGDEGATITNLKVSGLKSGNGYYVYIQTKSLFPGLGLDVISENPTTIFMPYTQPQGVHPTNDASLTTSQVIPLQITTLATEPIITVGVTVDGGTGEVLISTSDATRWIPGATSNTGTALVTVTGLANQKISASKIHVRAGGDSSVFANTVSPSVSPATGDDAFTKPDVPGTPNITAQGATSLTIDMAPALQGLTNPLSTAYRLEVSPSATDFSASGSQSISFAAGDAPITVNNLQSGVVYYARVKAIDVMNVPTSVNSAFDVASLVPAAKPTTIAPPVISNITTTGYTATWSLSPLALSNTPSLVYKVSDNTGPIFTSPAVPTTAAPQAVVDVSGQSATPSNSLFNVSLYACDGTGANCTLFPNSTGGSTTLAVAPSAPQIAMSGTAANIKVTVNLVADTNATDSLYAIQLALNGAAPQYLQGDGTLGSVIVLKTATQWTTGNANVYNNAGQATTISATVQVQQKLDNALLTSAPTVKKTPGGTVDAGFSAMASTVTLDNYIYGAPINGPFPITFGTDIDPTSLVNKVTLTRVSDGQVVPLDLSVGNYSSATQTLFAKPASGQPLDPSTAYKITLAAGIQDFLHIGATAGGQSIVFITALDPAKTSTVLSVYDTAKQVNLNVPSGSFPQGGFVVPRTSFISPNHTLTNGAYANNSLVRELGRVELLMYTLNGQGAPVLGNSPKTVTLTMTPAFAAAAAQNAASPAAAGAAVSKTDIDPSTIGIFQVQPQGLVKVPSSQVNSDGSVTAQVTAYGVYVLAADITTNLSGAKAYPVPFKPANGDTAITFDNLAANTTIKIYTIMGEVVKTIRVDGQTTVAWDVKNDNGANVASGVYVYQIKNAYSEKRGKLMVIR